MMRGGFVRWLVGTVVAVSGVTALQPATVAHAAFALDWYLPSEGVLRTNVMVSGFDLDPATGNLFASAAVGTTTVLMVIDPDVPSVVRQVNVESAVTDHTAAVDVSPDGDRVAVATRTALRWFRTSDLRALSSVTLPTAADWQVEVAPGSSRAVVWRSTRGYLVDGSVLTQLPGATTSTTIPKFSFGDTADVLFNTTYFDLRRLDVSGVPTIVATGSTRSQSFLAYVDGKVYTERGRYDAVTLTLEQGVPMSEPYGWYRKGTEGPLLVGDDGALLRFAPSDLTHEEWGAQVPEGMAYKDAIALPGGRIAVADCDPTSLQTDTCYLTVLDEGILASALGDYHPVTPRRVLDTRSGTGTDGATSPVGSGRSIRVQLAGRGGVPAQHVIAVALNLTVTQPTKASYFAVWSTGTERPQVSNLNFGPGTTIANFVTVPVGSDGSIQLFNRAGAAHALIDVVGYFVDEGGSDGGRFGAQSPQRLLDTRYDGNIHRLGPGQTVTIDTGSGMLATAVNVTAVDASSATYLTVWPAGEARPRTSTVNVAAGETRPNLAVTATAADGRISIYNAQGSVDVVVDLVGTFVARTAQFGPDGHPDQFGRLYQISPFRRFDSRESSPFPSPGMLAPDSYLILGGLQGWTSIVNLTAISPSAAGFLTVVPWENEQSGYGIPSTSAVNFQAGDVTANAAFAYETPDWAVYNRFGFTHVAVDVFGYFQGPIQSAADAWA